MKTAPCLLIYRKTPNSGIMLLSARTL